MMGALKKKTQENAFLYPMRAAAWKKLSPVAVTYLDISIARAVISKDIIGKIV